MNFKLIKQFTCSGGKAVPANPFNVAVDLPIVWKGFDIWAKDYVFACSPELNGVYGAEQVELVWQYLHFFGEWYNTPSIRYDEFETFDMYKEDSKKGYGIETRQFLQLKPQPMPEQSTENPITKFPETPKEVEEFEKRIGDPDVNFPLEEMYSNFVERFKNNESPEKRVKTENNWELIIETHSLADTGDFFSEAIITDGSIRLICYDEKIADEQLQNICDKLNQTSLQPANNDYAVKMIEERIKELNADLKKYCTYEDQYLVIEGKIKELNLVIKKLTPNN